MYGYELWLKIENVCRWITESVVFKKVVDIQRFGLKATNNSDDESYIF